ncbi:methyltransferase domain-containing protein [Hymenobacter latericus]|uniref:methyltransferase domain-containing protein n=1 Tax=Hymenobacter sp. YIM 151858-1 TaxID=2987688 RepID=UPI002225E41F|nr:methyltransferase domain-containing protein [Hymenobacter sp. YIM 151858-1]UYZ57942.1 methyltransferase domain-containing protein [Hymenobacter sp. YIM 151858-1]
MPDFARRSLEPELMDDLTLASDDLRQNLYELEVINARLGGYRVVLSALQRLRPRLPANRPVRIADLGSGGGDTLRRVAQWARRQGLAVELTGLDANAFMVDYARARSQGYPEIRFEQQDIFAPEFARQRYDVVMCSLFCHHFAEHELVPMLRQWREQARTAVVINDLHRHPLAYHSIRWLTRLLGGSYLVQNDAPLSVARAFRRHDWEELLTTAAITRYQLRWQWAFRWQLIIEGAGE